MNAQGNEPFVVRVRGGIDLHAAPSLRRALSAALVSNREVALDLSEVTFMDCAGPGAPGPGPTVRPVAETAALVLRGAGRRAVRPLKVTGLLRGLAVGPRPVPPGGVPGRPGRRENCDGSSMGVVPGGGPGTR
ncbi:STAS domain-containing protein [Kitasatospora sp. NPDC048540]|uniref:STAS domain-containing protein n=1 Tax=Kitasatospora sp. NPDC048540 TaxID=3155634 RepID=UPI0033D6DD20